MFTTFTPFVRFVTGAGARRDSGLIGCCSSPGVSEVDTWAAYIPTLVQILEGSFSAV